MTGRHHAKALARALVPPSVAVWNGPKSGRSTSRGVALTFDDGPTPLTPDYLSVLDRFGAKATFFVVGEQCEKHPELVRDVANAGHELAGHGYTHRRFPELSAPELRDELERTRALLPETRLRRPLVRPPHGAVSLASTIACARAGFTLVLWSHDSGDWCTSRPEEVVRSFDQALEPGAIVLFHEGQDWTLDALPEILGTLRKAGHELVTVGELLGN
jgi:peptidoglycan/xylan/chitin deacetylase (PgdA/CDA1 family)